MAKASPIQTAFNAGEFGPELSGRVDIGKYANACSKMENFFPLVQGPARKRAGTRFVQEVKNSADRTWLARFDFNAEQAYIIEFGDQYVRFYTDNGALTETAQNITGITAANPGVLTYSGADPSNGDWFYTSGIVGMTQMNGRLVKVANVNAGANTFELDEVDGTNINTTSYTAYSSGGTIARVYTLATPWALADLTNTDGTFALRMVQSGDILYVCHPDYAPQKLARTSATAWTCTEFSPNGGPFEDVDPDETITVFASAQSGTGVTIAASGSVFASSDVGRLFYLEQRKANAIKPWETSIAISANDLRRSDGKTYKALNSATTGSTKPTHSEGAEYDGGTGVQWEYQDPGYGWATITSVPTAASKTVTNCANNGAGLVRVTAAGHGYETGWRVTVASVTGTTEANGTWTVTRIDANNFDLQGSTYANAYISGGTSVFLAGSLATVDVLSLIPDQATTATNTTTRFAFGAWGSVSGYPSHVTFFRDRLVFARASDRRLWFSVAADYENFKDRDTGGLVTADMALSIQVQSDRANKIEYMTPADALIIGTAAGEHVCREMTDSEPFGPANVTIIKSSDHGAKSVNPVRVDESILFIQRSGRKLREITFDALQDGYKTADLSVLAPHVVPKGVSITGMCYQKDPNAIVWAVRNDGVLLGFTFNREQDVTGWHTHAIGGDFGTGAAVVEAVEAIPSPSNDRDDLWMIVKRTINGATKRYIEFMQPEFEEGDDQEDAFYVDCGLTYDGAAATTISGLSHLEGETVSILADGATHPARTVSGGAITLARSASVVQIGLPYTAKLATMRLNAGAADGTAQGKTKRINRVVVRLLDTLGGLLGPSETQTDELIFRTGSDAMDSAPPIFTGDKELAWSGGYEKDAIIWFVHDSPLPATVVAIMPQVTTQDR